VSGRAIGVSNFMPEHLNRLPDETSVAPAVNQIEVHPYFQQTELQRVHAEKGILTQAWSPIGGITSYRGGEKSTFDDATLLEIAREHGKSAAQVMLRWHLQERRSAIPKSTKPAPIAENFDVFDFELASEELTAIDALDTGVRGGPDPDSITLETFGREIPEAWPLAPSPGPEKTGAPMEYRLLGRTGIQVSKLCLGTMMFGAWGNSDHDDSIRIIHKALDAGINFVDTADVYSSGESEEIVGKALKGRRDDIVLATKFWGSMGDDPNRRGVSRRWIIAEVENSLRRLGTDWIDLYQMHRPDPDTDVEETLGALTDLVHQGKIRYIGSSSFSAGEIVEAQWAARERRLERFRTEQPPYSILVRGIELDVLPTASRHRMGILTYSPLAGGWLSGRWSAETTPTSPARQRLVARFDMSLPENQRKLEATEALGALAGEAGLSLIELAIAFVVNHPAVTSAIIGPRTMEQLDSQLPAADVTLDALVLDRIDEIVRPGVNLNPADTSYGEQVLEPSLRWR
jgi:aryl-alcohol dehydrogenase-like predicted oxidoreductase